MSDEYVRSILDKKEYHIAKTHFIDESPEQEDISADIRKYVFSPKSYQLFARHFMHPLTPVNRVLLKYGTGAGKTATSLYISMYFVEQKRPTLVLGFTKRAFLMELIKYPEFGYASFDEIEHLRQLKYTAEQTKNSIDELAYTDARAAIRRRIKDFTFYGYRTFVNRIITYNGDINELSEKQIREMINAGTIKLNKQLMEKFRGGLVICDEIHNVYNSTEKNNWGIVLQLLLDYLGNDVKVVLLSATPLTHRAREIIDIASLLGKKLPEQYTMGDISTALAGRVLFVEDSNPKYYPKSTRQGMYLPGVDMLKFTPCLASDEHAKVLSDLSGSDAYYAHDMVFPVDDAGIKLVYNSHDVRNITQNSLVKITFDGDSVKITGPILQRKNLPKYSAKYAAMLDKLLELYRGGKTLIYHKYVRITGALLIAEILKQNGFLDEQSSPNNNSLDMITGLTYAEHAAKGIKTEFTPARFMLVHSDIDQAVRDRIVEKFNAPDNARGMKYCVLIGAEVIKESFDIKDIRYLFVMHKPDDINTMRQIDGRGKRFLSHQNLPPEDRTIDYYIFVTTVKKGMSPEVAAYKTAIDEYKEIQQIETVLNRIAVDAELNMKMLEYSFVNANEVGVQKFEPKYKYITPINCDLYNNIYAHWEVTQCVYIIKRLYTVSLVWKLEDLIRAVRNPPFTVEFDTSLIARNSIIVALYKLYWQRLANYKIVLPDVSGGNYVTSMFSQIDKILQIGNREYIITQCGEYFIALPFTRSEDGPIISYYPESMYRLTQPVSYNIDIKSYIARSSAGQKFDASLAALRKTYGDKSIMETAGILCEFNVEFHSELARRCIVDVYNIMITKMGGMEPFMLNVFVIYVIFDIVVFYADISAEKQARYNLPLYEREQEPQMPLQKYLDFWRDMLAAPGKIKAVHKYLPVGYYFEKSYLYLDGEFIQTDMVAYKKWVDNPILVGFFEKSATGVRLRFKIRPPQEDVDDARKKKNGAICTTRPKAEIVEYCRRLKVDVKDESQYSSGELCTILQRALFELEAEERRKRTDIKYFYMYWEL